MVAEATKSKRRLRRDIENVIAEQRARLMARETALVADLESMYNKALDAIEITALNIAGKTTVSSQVMRAQLLTLVDDVVQQLLILDSQSVDLIEIEQRFAVLQSARDMAQILETMGVPSRLSVNAATRATAAVHGESPLLRLLVRKSIDAGEKARTALIVGTIKGDNPRVVARDLRRALNEPKYSAERIARTEVLRNYRGAMRERMAESNVAIGWIWISARDSRTCAFCWANHGKRFGLDQPMPTHPNCRCSQAPALTNGMDVTASGNESFARLSATQKRTILGPSKYEAYRNGEIVLDDLVGFKENPDWGRIGYERSLREIRGTG